MTKRYLLAFVLSGLSLLSLSGQEYKRLFCDSTLRLDYIFAGDARQTNITLEEISTFDGWAGRHHRMNELPLEGNGRITMHSLGDSSILYRTSFSSLYQEWLSTPQAIERREAYENVFLLPMPREKVIVEIELNDMHHKLLAVSSHIVDPKDILLRHLTTDPLYPYCYLQQSGDPSTCIDVAILPEGYTEAEMPAFYAAAERTVRALLKHRPFAEMKDRFNILAVELPSADSGVSVPRANKWLNTPFGSHFDTFYSDRYLTTRRVKAIHNALVGIPYEHIIILANTNVYGGGGIYNAFTLTTTGHRDFEPVVVHEFGHSFGGLADEYAYEQDVMSDTYSRTIEPWEQNVTNLIDFDGKKWFSLLPQRTPLPTPVEQATKYPVGYYEGAAYSTKGFYRASLGCRMRENKTPDFCPACRLALTKLIDFYTR